MNGKVGDCRVKCLLRDTCSVTLVHMGACGRGLSPIFSIIAPHDAIFRRFTVFNNPWKWALLMRSSSRKTLIESEIATPNRLNDGSKKWSKFRDKFPWIVGQDHSDVQFRFFTGVNWHTGEEFPILVVSSAFHPSMIRSRMIFWVHQWLEVWQLSKMKG